MKERRVDKRVRRVCTQDTGRWPTTPMTYGRDELGTEAHGLRREVFQTTDAML